MEDRSKGGVAGPRGGRARASRAAGAALAAAARSFQAGEFRRAEAQCGDILKLEPDNPDALHLFGVLKARTGDKAAAADFIGRAIALNPDLADAHGNLCVLLRDLGRIDEAIASGRRAIALNPGNADAHTNLGVALWERGDLAEAIAAYRAAIALKPTYAEAHTNLGGALRDQGKLDDALACCRKAMEVKPDHTEAHYCVGSVLMNLGRFREAKAAIDRGLRLKYGGPWWNAATFADGDEAAIAPLAEAPSASPFKLLDTADQLQYLIGKGRIDPSFQIMVERYRAVLVELQRSERPAARNMLTPAQSERIGSFYNRIVHYADAPRIDTGVVNPSLDFERIEDGYLSSPVSVTAVDDFLTPEALRALRDYCLESTIFFNFTGNRFVSGKIASGFNCDILYQMAEELKQRFPRMLGGHALQNMWVYRYRNQGEGVAAHTDNGAVTFNFWITPDDANLTPGRGGLVVYAKEQPHDWNWRRYSIEKYTPAISREIDDFLADAETVTIPYRENRAVLFHSNLFHKSDQARFRDGYENRRMNVTMLFGKRGVAGAEMLAARYDDIRAKHAKESPVK